MPISTLVHDIQTSRLRLLESLAALNRQQASTPIDDGRWSPLQYLEHLVRAEEATVWRMFRAVDDVRTSGQVLCSPTPALCIEEVVELTWAPREESPPLATPELGAPIAYWRVRMARNNALIRAFAGVVDEADLDTVAYLHPISGPLTLRQGLEFVRFHIDRHHGHIREARTTGCEGVAEDSWQPPS